MKVAWTTSTSGGFSQPLKLIILYLISMPLCFIDFSLPGRRTGAENS